MRNAIGTPYTGLTQDQVHDLNMKLYDLIQSLEYNVDAPDLHNAMQINLGWFEMNDTALDEFQRDRQNTPLARGFLFYYVVYKNR